MVPPHRRAGRFCHRRRGEIALTVTDDATLDATHAAWAAKGLSILQPPTDMDFGRTFVALDPDGHRLRVFRPY